MALRPEDAAWLAAAIDGEGSISINWAKRKDGSKRPFAKISVSNAYKEFLEKVERIIGSGGVSLRKGKGVRFENYVYSCQRIDLILGVLKEIRPILIVKAKNADIVIDFLEKKMRMEENNIPERTECLKPGGSSNKNKGWRGDSEAHRKAAACVKNHHLKGWRGDRAGHARAGKMKGINSVPVKA